MNNTVQLSFLNVHKIKAFEHWRCWPKCPPAHIWWFHCVKHWPVQPHTSVIKSPVWHYWFIHCLSLNSFHLSNNIILSTQVPANLLIKAFLCHLQKSTGFGCQKHWIPSKYFNIDSLSKIVLVEKTTIR